MTHSPKRQFEARGFSLLETAVVVTIAGLVALIAIPRLSSMIENSTVAIAKGNAAVLEKAIGHYAAEHEDRTPANETDGSVTADGKVFVARLVLTSNSGGDTGDDSSKYRYGPYLRDIPPNPVNGLRRIRIDGDAAGANTHGWRYNSASRVVEPDDGYVPLVLAGKPASLASAKAASASTSTSAAGGTSGTDLADTSALDGVDLGTATSKSSDALGTGGK